MVSTELRGICMVCILCWLRVAGCRFGWPGSTSGGLAAVDDHGVPDGERGLLRAHPQHGRGDLLGAADAADRLLADDRGAALVGVAGEAPHHLRVDDAGADGVDADALCGVV